jgi:hypothetical protein
VLIGFDKLLQYLASTYAFVIWRIQAILDLQGTFFFGFQFDTESHFSLDRSARIGSFYVLKTIRLFKILELLLRT